MADGFTLSQVYAPAVEWSPMNSDCLQRLDRAVGLASRPRLMKFLTQPHHLGRSKLLELLAHGKPEGIPSVAETFWDQPMHVVLPERVSLTLLRYGYFEAELTRALIRLLQPGMVFFDVGAHIGYFSLLTSELVGAQGRVHTFEPTPTTFALLRRNTDSKANITLVNAAVYSKAGPVQLHDFGIMFSAFNSIYAGKMQDRERRGLRPREYTAPAVTLAHYIETTQVIPNVIKIDAEGAELSILQGLEPAFGRCRPIITVEVGDTIASGDMPRSRLVVDWLIDHGYRPTEFEKGEFAPHRLENTYHYTNLVCFPG